jgi:hypothetical protein
MRTSIRRIASITAVGAAATAMSVGAAGTAGAQAPLQGSLEAAGLVNQDGTFTEIGQSVGVPIITGSGLAFFGVCLSVEMTGVANCPT